MSISRWIATGGGIGDIRFVPGTVASLIAAVIGGIALWISQPLLVLITILACLVGVWAVRGTGQTSDQRWIVADEFAGTLVALLGLARVSLTGVLAAFLIFRLLNIFKPGPVGWVDRKDGALSIMADDIVAGLLTAAILFLMRLLPPVLLWGWLPVDLLP